MNKQDNSIEEIEREFYQRYTKEVGVDNGDEYHAPESYLELKGEPESLWSFIETTIKSQREQAVEEFVQFCWNGEVDSYLDKKLKDYLKEQKQ